jgi:ribosome biogenesis GTPase
MNDTHLGADFQAPMPLIQFGWNDLVAAAFHSVAEPGDIPARVVAVHRNRIVVATSAGERNATLHPRLASAAPEERPATGDWISLRVDHVDTSARAHVVVPRRTAFIRRAAGEKATAQVVAANIDRVLVVTALPHDMNERRLERYLALAWESGAVPAVVLTKCDLVSDVEDQVTRVHRVAPGVDVIAVSATSEQGIDELRTLIAPGTTIALLGSSGVGKSTLVNRLAGSTIMRTADVDRDGRGRHTTTHRELVRLENGMLVIDTPGMREMQLWSAEAGLEQVFEDIVALSESCRFSDCRHDNEPGCAVAEAVASGAMSAERLRSWRKLVREAARSQLETDAVASSAERAKLRSLMRSVRAHVRAKNER